MSDVAGGTLDNPFDMRLSLNVCSISNLLQFWSLLEVNVVSWACGKLSDEQIGNWSELYGSFKTTISLYY